MAHRQGELSRERAEKTEKMKGAFTRMHANAVALADALSLDLPPEIDEEEEEEELAEGALSLFRGVMGGDGSELEGPFEDETTRTFYEELPDVRALVPAAILSKSLRAAGLGESTSEGASKGAGKGGAKKHAFIGDFGSDAGPLLNPNPYVLYYRYYISCESFSHFASLPRTHL